MPWVQRDLNGKIIGCYMPMQPGVAEEWLDDNAPELVMMSKSDRITKLQFAYESDRDKLNKAWLSAIISDGVQETARKAVISAQMVDLSTKLEADIFAIITEA